MTLSYTNKHGLEYYVYAYIRSKDSSIATAGTPYYIGKGTGSRAFDKHNHKVKVPRDPSMVVIIAENLTEMGAFALERRLIRYWGRIDNQTGILRNYTDGGQGHSGFIKSETTRKKLSESLKGKPKSEDYKSKRRGVKRPDSVREKLSKAFKGRKKSAEHITKMKGRTVSEETKQKLRDARKKQGALSPESIQKGIKKRKGFQHSEESKQKMRDAAKGRVFSEEHKRKIRESCKGKAKTPFTDAHKKAMSEAKRGHLVSEDARKKISETKRRNPILTTCEHCGKIATVQMIARHHGDKCKTKLTCE